MSMELSDRSAYVGVHIKPAVKDAFQHYAKVQGVSMSWLAAQWIEEKLRAEGETIVEQPVYTGEALPL